MNDDRFVISPPPDDEVGGNAKRSFVSRAGLKLDAALTVFKIDCAAKICADLGANVGGFTDCLLQRGAAKVYAVDTAYGVLAWTLRKNPRVVVRERTNALHVTFPERIQIAAVDVGWTRQEKILPVVAGLLVQGGEVLTLVKPHYESEQAKSQGGVLEPEQSEQVLHDVMQRVAAMVCAGKKWDIKGIVRSPIEGQKGNTEYIAWLQLAWL